MLVSYWLLLTRCWWSEIEELSLKKQTFIKRIHCSLLCGWWFCCCGDCCLLSCSFFSFSLSTATADWPVWTFSLMKFKYWVSRNTAINDATYSCTSSFFSIFTWRDTVRYTRRATLFDRRPTVWHVWSTGSALASIGAAIWQKENGQWKQCDKEMSKYKFIWKKIWLNASIGMRSVK